jgi:hypothetical protein
MGNLNNIPTSKDKSTDIGEETFKDQFEKSKYKNHKDLRLQKKDYINFPSIGI